MRRRRRTPYLPTTEGAKLLMRKCEYGVWYTAYSVPVPYFVLGNGMARVCSMVGYL